MRRITLTPFARVPVCRQRAVLKVVILQISDATDVPVGSTGSSSTLGNFGFALRPNGGNEFIRD